MVAFNFSPEFARKVETGKKRRTIRSKQRADAGDKVQLYTGQRTKKCRLLGTGVCLRAFPVKIYQDGINVGSTGEHPWSAPFALRAEADGDRVLLDSLAKVDGFKDWPAMRDWFKKRYGLPYSGVAHDWKLDRKKRKVKK